MKTFDQQSFEKIVQGYTIALRDEDWFASVIFGKSLQTSNDIAIGLAAFTVSELAALDDEIIKANSAKLQSNFTDQITAAQEMIEYFIDFVTDKQDKEEQALEKPQETLDSWFKSHMMTNLNPKKAKEGNNNKDRCFYQDDYYTNEADNNFEIDAGMLRRVADYKRDSDDSAKKIVLKHEFSVRHKLDMVIADFLH